MDGCWSSDVCSSDLQSEAARGGPGLSGYPGPMTGTAIEPEIAELAAGVADAVLTPLRFLERSATVWAQRPAVVSGETTRTYAEHDERVRRLAGVLTELGVQPGDRVATLLPNTEPMLEAHYAVPGIGAILVPLNTRLAPAEYAYVLEHSGAS